MVKIKSAFLAGILLALASVISCSSESPEEGGKGGPTPPTPNGEVTIGTQVWMSKNLDTPAAGSKCYGEGGPSYVWDEGTDDYIEKTLSPSEVQANCTKYGRLYDWATAMALDPSCNSSFCSDQIRSPHQGICPSGWHIPSNDDWDKLFRFADGTSGTESPYDSPTAGKHLKAKSGWNSYQGKSGNGTDEYGFSALPGGYGSSDGSFDNVGDNGYCWSAGEHNSYYAYRRYMYYNYEYARWYGNYKSSLLSVRCLQD